MRSASLRVSSMIDREAIVERTDLTLTLEPHVLAAARGDREAFSHLVDATRTAVGAIALAILRDVEASRDVAQDVFLAAWQDLGKLRNSASFLPWLRQMTRNRAHHVLRSRVRRRASSPSPAERSGSPRCATLGPRCARRCWRTRSGACSARRSASFPTRPARW